MTPLTKFLRALALAFGVALTIVLILKRPMRHVIAELCGTDERATFWMAYLNTQLIMAPLLGVSFFMGFVERGADLATFLQRSLFWTILTLMAALFVIGWGLWRPSSRLFDEAHPLVMAAGRRMGNG